jgi:hypothetical protein
MAREHPEKCATITIDGADESDYHLPHFGEATKRDAAM